MTLTEQWKKGELEFGKEYYVRFEDGEIDTAKWCYYTNQNKYGFDVDDVEEVLAPVPSYEEWQEEQKSLKVLAEAYCKEKEENQQLKELLLECRPYVDQATSIIFDENDIGLKPWQINRCIILTKIDNAIGEK